MQYCTETMLTEIPQRRNGWWNTIYAEGQRTTKATFQHICLSSASSRILSFSFLDMPGARIMVHVCTRALLYQIQVRKRPNAGDALEISRTNGSMRSFETAALVFFDSSLAPRIKNSTKLMGVFLGDSFSLFFLTDPNLLD